MLNLSRIIWFIPISIFGFCGAIDFFPKLEGDINGINFLRFDCDTSKCDPIPIHYEELGCKPIIEAGKCCPTSFDCQHLNSREESKCHLAGKVYKNGDKIDDSLIQPLCETSCTCSKEMKKFVCEHINCAEKFESRLNESCVRQYSLDKCCSTSTICGGSVEKLSSCKFEGRIYREGEKMVSQQFKCHNCVCIKDFNNISLSSIDENKACRKINCHIELFEMEYVKKGCAPIYHPDLCCPHNWRCPTLNDGIIPSGNPIKKLESPKCKFGNLLLNIGDSLSSSELYCSKCTCKIPPIVDCIFTSC